MYGVLVSCRGHNFQPRFLLIFRPPVSDIMEFKRNNSQKNISYVPKKELQREKKEKNEDSDPHKYRWMNCLRKLERLRMSHGYTIQSLFDTINVRGTKYMTVSQFKEVIVEFLPSVRDFEALALGKKISRQKISHGYVTAKGLAAVLGSVNFLSSVSGLLVDHPIFPDWLTNRNDFQSLFEEWNSDNGCPSLYIVERTCAAPSEERRPADLTVLLKWLKVCNVLQQVRTSRLIDCARRLTLMHVPAGMAIVTQGEPGDAFYVVLSGSLDVLIDGNVVNTMLGGTSFGEKALENDAPRSATVIAAEPCKLMTLLASDYKSLMSHARMRQDKELAVFLMSKCKPFKHYSTVRTRAMIKTMVRQRYTKGEQCLAQNETAGALLIIIKGNVKLRRIIAVRSLVENQFIRRKESFMFVGDGLPGSHRRKSQQFSGVLSHSPHGSCTTSPHHSPPGSRRGSQLSTGGVPKSQSNDAAKDSSDHRHPSLRRSSSVNSAFHSTTATRHVTSRKKSLVHSTSCGHLPPLAATQRKGSMMRTDRRTSQMSPPSSVEATTSAAVSAAALDALAAAPGHARPLPPKSPESVAGLSDDVATLSRGRRRSSTGASGGGSSVMVQLDELGPGDILGDDCLRTRSFNSYAAMAMTDVEVLVVNTKNALEHFRGDALRTVLAITANRHRTDREFLDEQESDVRKQLLLKRVRTAALPVTYSAKMTAAAVAEEHAKRLRSLAAQQGQPYDEEDMQQITAPFRM